MAFRQMFIIISKCEERTLFMLNRFEHHTMRPYTTLIYTTNSALSTTEDTIITSIGFCTDHHFTNGYDHGEQAHNGGDLDSHGENETICGVNNVNAF